MSQRNQSGTFTSELDSGSLDTWRGRDGCDLLSPSRRLFANVFKMPMTGMNIS